MERLKGKTALVVGAVSNHEALRRGEDAAPQSLIHNAANEIGLYSKKSSCPALRRASTSWLHLSKKDVDGRDI